MPAQSARGKRAPAPPPAATQLAGRRRRVATLAATLAALPAHDRAKLARAVGVLETVARGA
jgi:hypothetical protein